MIVNYDQIDGQPYDDWSGGLVSFRSPLPTTIGTKEAWHLKCTTPQGKVRNERDVVVDRGQTVDVGKVCNT